MRRVGRVRRMGRVARMTGVSGMSGVGRVGLVRVARVSRGTRVRVRWLVGGVRVRCMGVRGVVRLGGRSRAHAPLVAAERREGGDGGSSRTRHCARAADGAADRARSSAVGETHAERAVEVTACAALGAPATCWSYLIALESEPSRHCCCSKELGGGE